jgi:hypothetical protein
MILEGIITTINADGRPNIAPMGALVDEPGREPLARVILRPFPTAVTYANLRRTGQAVFHVTDDVELLARAAIGPLDPLPAMRPAEAVEGRILTDACRWYALRVRRRDDSGPRAEIETEVVDAGRIRDFFGFNRAKAAVVEAAILATRVHLLSPNAILADLARLAVLVEKTGGRAERSAFALLEAYVRQGRDSPK